MSIEMIFENLSQKTLLALEKRDCLMEARDMGITWSKNQVRAAIIYLLSFFVLSPAFAQEWVVYQSERDGFQMEIPPGTTVRVAESTFESYTGFKLPSRIYSVEHGAERYSVTVADYTGIQALGRAKLKTCTPGAEICTGTPLSGEGFWKHDVRGAMLHATALLVKRDAKVMDLSWNQISRVSTTHVSLANNDGSRTYALITMNKRLLYIAEGTVPKGGPSAVRFGGSFSLIAPAGTPGGFAYPSLYSNEIYGVGDIPGPPPLEGISTDGGVAARPFRPDEFD